MHKKVIAGSTYYYTTQRNKDGQHRTYYLGRDAAVARKKEAEILGKNCGLNLKSHSFKNLYLLLIGLCGLTLILLSGQITGFFVFSPPTVEFDINEGWNLSEAALMIDGEELPVSDFIADGKIVLDISELNATKIELVVSGLVVDSYYASEEEGSPEDLESEVAGRLELEEGIDVTSVEKEEDEYKVTVNLEAGGSVVVQVGNVSDVKRVQVVKLEDNVIWL